jgi:hypothetical protein
MKPLTAPRSSASLAWLTTTKQPVREENGWPACSLPMPKTNWIGYRISIGGSFRFLISLGLR